MYVRIVIVVTTASGELVKCNITYLSLKSASHDAVMMALTSSQAATGRPKSSPFNDGLYDVHTMCM
jgi:hypothetical protein